MPLRTTAVELKGDKYRAEQLSLAHVERLLYNFRRNTGSLNINAARVNFFDDTGKFIGEIYMHTVFGAETVIVKCPSGVTKKQEELKVILPTDRIVPCMRSTDNQWWVACLSGTFNGPYYAFKNIYNIAVEDMSDNEEINLNRKLISIGAPPINGAQSPRLFFVAQTATRPKLGSYGWELDATDEGFNGFGVQDYRFTYVELPETPVYPHPALHEQVFTTEYSYSVSQDHYIWEQQFSIPSRAFSYSETRVVTGWRYDFPAGPITDLLDITTVYDYATTTVQAIRAEQSSISNFACCYLEWRVNETARYIETPGPDYTATIEISPEEIPHTKTYYLQVDDKVFEILKVEDWHYNGDSLNNAYYAWLEEGPKEMVAPEGGLRNYGTPDGNTLKYYGPSSAAPITALFCGVVSTSEPIYDGSGYTGSDTPPECVRFDYHYVGPNTQEPDTISTTTFIPEDATAFEHIIANVIGLPSDDSIKFRGEIFLGLIRYQTEEIIPL